MGRLKKHKHFGDRDPLRQREEREQKLIREKKINNPPTEDQAVSKRFKKFVQIKQAVSQPQKIQKSKNKKSQLSKQIGKRVTVHDDFDLHDNLGKKMTNESNKQHLRRVEEVIAKKKTEAEYAKKYGIQIIRDINGEIKMKKDPLAAPKKKKVKKEEPVVEKKEAEENEPTFPLIKYKMSAKMKRKLEMEEKPAQDIVKFGEVALEPPTFNLSQKQNQKVTKPGKRNYLFLSKLNLK